MKLLLSRDFPQSPPKGSYPSKLSVMFFFSSSSEAFGCKSLTFPFDLQDSS